MTIGLAALCQGENGAPLVVVASDRMVTYPGLIEYEHAVPKMSPASSHAITMIAGDTLVAVRLVEEVVGALMGTNPRVADIASQLADRYDQVRIQHVEQTVLSPRGLSLQTFYGSHQSLNGQLVMVADQAMMQFDLNVELIVAGVDPSGGHIFTIHNPGRVERKWDAIGHAGIGSGGIHTLQSMIGFHHVPMSNFTETLFWVYASKKRAEVAPGVGVDTDMAVISVDGIRRLTNDQIIHLDNVYDHYRQSLSEALTRELGSIHLDQPFEQAPVIEQSTMSADAPEGTQPPKDETSA